MGNKIMAHYVAEAQAGTKSKSEQQPVRGGDYVAQSQLDYRATRDIGSSNQTSESRISQHRALEVQHAAKK
jgi:hypothetical protein